MNSSPDGLLVDARLLCDLAYGLARFFLDGGSRAGHEGLIADVTGPSRSCGFSPRRLCPPGTFPDVTQSFFHTPQSVQFQGWRLEHPGGQRSFGVWPSPFCRGLFTNKTTAAIDKKVFTQPYKLPNSSRQVVLTDVGHALSQSTHCWNKHCSCLNGSSNSVFFKGGYHSSDISTFLNRKISL